MSGDNNVGGLAGHINDGTVTGCYVTGDVSGDHNVGGLAGYINDGTVTACHATGAVSGRGYVGGLVGYSDGGTLSTSFTTGDVAGISQLTGSYTYYAYDIGGLIGYTKESAVTACYATGGVSGYSRVGGLAGYSIDSTVTACYAAGEVSGLSTNLGGLLGSGSGEVTVTASFWDMEVSGQAASSGGRGLTTAEMTTVRVFQNAGWSAYDWVMTPGAYPRLAWEGTGAPAIPAPEAIALPGSGTEGDPYVVQTPAEFAALSWHAGYAEAHVRLGADLDCGGLVLHPIGDLAPFTGNFDGNGYAIRNATFEQPGNDSVALFGTVGAGGVVHDVFVEDCWVDGDDYVGGLVGANRGTVAACQITGVVSGDYYVGGLIGFNYGLVEDCGATVAVSGYSSVGGLVGYSKEGSVTACYAAGAVSGSGSIGGLAGCVEEGAITAGYATGDVLGHSYVGGLAGRNASGTVTACYAAGPVSGDSDVGGLVGGLLGESTAAASFWDTESTGHVASRGGKGLTTAEMQTVRVFQNAGWSAYGWAMTDGAYPRLVWEGTGDPAIPAPEAIPLPGSGTAGDPYLVGSAAEFAGAELAYGLPRGAPPIDGRRGLQCRCAGSHRGLGPLRGGFRRERLCPSQRGGRTTAERLRWCLRRGRGGGRHP